MDRLNNLKGRIGEAFVESILRQANYKVCRLGRASQFPHMLKIRSEEFVPDFLVWTPEDHVDGELASRHFLSIEIKFRSKLEKFLRPSEVDPLLQQGDQWPDLYVVLVTDHPVEGRSCFQVLDRKGSDPDTPVGTIDLHESRALGIEKAITDAYEELVRQVYSPLTSTWPESNHQRKPPTKGSISNGVSVETSTGVPSTPEGKAVALNPSLVGRAPVLPEPKKV